MTGTIEISEVSLDEWPILISTFMDLTYEQDVAFIAAGAKRIGAQVRAFVVRRDGDLIGAACLRIKIVPVLNRGIAYLSAGPIIEAGQFKGDTNRLKEVLMALRMHLVDKEGHLLRIRLPTTTRDIAEADILHANFFPTDRSHKYKTVLINLDFDESTLRSKLHPKWRYELRRAEGEDLEIIAGHSLAMVERFLKLYRDMRSFKSFEEQIDPVFLRNMVDTSFNFEVRIARHEGLDVGGHVTAYTPACATYLFGATTELGRALRAGYALGWDAVKSARAQGICWFDLGGVDKTKNSPGYTFKIRTGGHEISALGPYEAGSHLGGIILRGIEGLYTATKNRRL